MRFRALVTTLALMSITQIAAAQGGSLRVLASNGMKAVIDDLRPQIERDLGRPLAIEFGTTAGLRQKIAAGEVFDVAVLTTEAITALASEGTIAAPSVGALGRSGIGVAVRAGGPVPPVRTPDELKRALLAAKSLTWVGVGASRPGIERMLDTLGITADVQPKVTLASSVDAANESVVAGRVDIALTLASEILPAKDLAYAGPLPADLQSYVSFAAGVAAKTTAGTDTARVVESLRARSAAATYKARGMEIAIAP